MSENSSLCLHCSTPVPVGSNLGSFCCAGCEAVYGLLRQEGLTRYYDLAQGATAPVPETSGTRSHAWLDPILERSEESSSTICNLELDIQGVHCSACVWLINELFRRQDGGAACTVNPALGKVQLSWKKGLFDARRFLQEVERFGYLFGPSRKKTDEASRGLLFRLGLAVALTMNVMIFSVSFYVGLAPEEEEIFKLFSQLSLWLSTGVVIIGGSVFFKPAWQAIRRGVLHLDMPIAAGILLAYGTSLWHARGGRGDLAYFDTLNVFVTLMLAGRWVQQRVLDRNRRYLLEDDGADGITVRRREGECLVAVPAPKVRSGDHLVVAPGDLVPVDSQLLDSAGAFSTDWITGESEIRELQLGETIPAGAFNAGRRAIAALAKTDFEDSPLPSLLRSGDPQASAGRGAHTRFWDLWSRIYVSAVIFFATLGFVIWWPRDPEMALQVTVALLVVTCPCAIGIAIPLSYEIVQARLRGAGFFVRRKELLDKLPRVRKVLFDKTGTLTLGRLELVDTAPLVALDEAARDAAYDMSSRSNHPVSRCLSAELGRLGARFSPDADVEEVPGQGLLLSRGGHVFRLGRPSFAAPDVEGLSGTVLSIDGSAAAALHTTESVRSDAHREIASLRDEGMEIWLISGDAQPRVTAMAAALGIDAKHALGGQRPEDKAETVTSLDREDTLFLGDGVNDSLAFERAHCAGTPAVDRPVLPGKADFFLLGEGLSGLREAISVSRDLQRVVRRNVCVALAYNVLAVIASLAGWMTPLRAAIFMPTSSITLLLVTITSLQAVKRAGRKQRSMALNREVEVEAAA